MVLKTVKYVLCDGEREDRRGWMKAERSLNFTLGGLFGNKSRDRERSANASKNMWAILGRFGRADFRT